MARPRDVCVEEEEEEEEEVEVEAKEVEKRFVYFSTKTGATTDANTKRGKCRYDST